jgi:hypothetical protein
VKKYFFIGLLCFSNTVLHAQQPINYSSVETEKYLEQVNQRFLLDGDKSIEQILLYIGQNSGYCSYSPQSSWWLLENYTYQKWNSSSWQNDSNHVLTYNQNNRLSERRIRDWSGSQWIDQCRYLYEYDQLQRTNMQKFQVYSSNTWNDSLKKKYDYNSQGMVSTITTLHWRNSVWQNWELMTSTYSNGQILQDVYQNWNDSTWENSSRTFYEYYASTINITFDTWLFGMWVNLLRIIINYDLHGYIAELKIQLWIPFIGWENLTRSLFTWHNNLITEGLTQNWDFDNSAWINYSRVTTIYNSNNLPKIDLTEFWTENSNWEYDFQSTHLYDGYLNRKETIGQQWTGINWINIERDLFTYIDVSPVKTSTFNLTEFKLLGNYPNPFNPTTSIRFHIPELSKVKLKIYNAIGEEVAVLINKELSQGTYDIIWNADGFKSGVYFYQLSSNEYIETKKMILLK